MDLEKAISITEKLVDTWLHFNEGIGTLSREDAMAACEALKQESLDDLLLSQEIVRQADAQAKPGPGGVRIFHTTLTPELVAVAYIMLHLQGQPLTGKQSPVGMFNGLGVFLIQIPAPDAEEEAETETNKKA